MAGGIDREIRISASDTGVSSQLQKLKEGALALGRGIADDARKQANSTKELIQLMREEISLIEKRNKLNKEAREMDLRNEFSSSESSSDKDSLRKGLERISIESKEDKMQTDLLKQILQSILKTSEDEIRENRENVQSKISSDREIDQLEDHEAALKQTFQRQILQDTQGDDEVREVNDIKKRGNSSVAKMGGFVKDTDLYTIGYTGAGEFLTSRASSVENKLGKRALLAGGIVGGAVGIGIQSANDLIEGRGDLTRVTGLSRGDQAGFDVLTNGLDLTQAQALKRVSQIISAGGGNEAAAGNLNALLAFERGFGVDSSVLARTSRFSNRNAAVSNMGAARMVMDDPDTKLHRSRTNELLQLQLEMTEKQFMATGSGTPLLNTAIISRILSGQDVKSVERARGTIQNIDNLVGTQDTQLNALMFSEFQKGGGGDLIDFLKEKEKGSSGVLGQALMSRVINSDMSRKDKILSLSSMGFGVTESEEILRSGGVSPKGFGQLREGAFQAGLLARDETTVQGQGTNEILASSSLVTDSFAALGEAAVDLAAYFKSAIGGGSSNQSMNPNGLPSNNTAAGGQNRYGQGGSIR